jgi:2-oxoisovalerate ferredoxin oxidoreductase beta subunit
MAMRRIGRPDSLYATYERKGGSAPTATHYCPGCGHGVVHKLLAEAIDDMEIRDRTVVISPVGCAVFAYYYFRCGNVEAAHGRAPAVGTGLSRARDNAVVISYQGDGDLASIGLNETLQAANRGEKLAVIFVNNTVYGMTGGQMAPTTLVGERTITSLEGRDAATSGHPLHMCELVSTLEAPVYVERVSVSDIRHVRRARTAIRKALQIQAEGKGYAFVEILSPCPTSVEGDPESCANWINEVLEKEFPCKVFRDRIDEAQPIVRPVPNHTKAAVDAAFELETESIPEVAPDPDFGTFRLKVSGFGGQGVISLGIALAQAGGRASRYVAWYPSYGPEQRGGTANCSVVVSGDPIGSPVVDNPDVLIAMNQPSLDRFVADVLPGGTVLYDSTVAEVGETLEAVKGTLIGVPATDIAKEAGMARAANTVFLGVMLQLQLVKLPEQAFVEAVQHALSRKPHLVPTNLDVLKAGAAWAREHLGA